LKEQADIILLLTPVYVALFWGIVLHIRGDEKNRARNFLGKFMAVAFVTYISHFFFFQKIHDVYIWLDCFYHLGSLSLYPMFYVYVRLLVVDERTSFRKHLKFFAAPLAVFVAMAVGYIVMEYEKDYYFISQVLYGMSSGDLQVRYMQLLLKLERVIFIGQAILYVYLIAKLTVRHHKLLWERYSSTEHLTIRWVQVLNYTLFISVLATTVFHIMGRISFLDSPVKLAFPTLTISVMVFILGVLGNKQKQVIIRELNDNSDLPEVVDAKILPKLKEELVGFFENELPFLDKDLTIWDVAEKLGSNRTYVSRIINRDFGQTFTAFVNSYRVAFIKKMLDENPNYPAEDLAEIGGFGSTTSLYRAFLTAEKISMAEYRKLLRLSGQNNISVDLS
jgi:AraC-like DNA-binding protein